MWLNKNKDLVLGTHDEMLIVDSSGEDMDVIDSIEKTDDVDSDAMLNMGE